MTTWLLSTLFLLTSCASGTFVNTRNPSSVDGASYRSNLCALSFLRLFRSSFSTQIVDVKVSQEVVKKYFPESISLKPQIHSFSPVQAIMRSYQSPKLAQAIRRSYTRNEAVIFEGEFIESILQEDRLYSYAIRNTGVVSFGKSGSTLNDLISKHTIITNGEQDVAYAGETLYSKGVLFVSNDSGTFRPNPEDLPSVRDFFRNEVGFAGKIVTYTYKDNLVELVKLHTATSL